MSHSIALSRKEVGMYHKEVKRLKKLRNIALAVILCLCISGCQVQSSETNNTSKQNTESQNISFGGVCFQIPQEWEKEMEEKNYLGYMGKQENNGAEAYLSISIEPNTEINTMLSNLQYGLKHSQEKGVEIKHFEHKAAEINHIPAEKVKYTQKTDRSEGEIQVVFFQIDDGVMEFTFYSQGKADYEVFEEVIQSVRFE